eukprot:8865475-Prorocentrum_lima.AAC.1
MTSSLVGSEMCIRDSLRYWDVAVLSKAPGSTREKRGAAACSANLAWSVSYTHLTLPTICSV